MMIIIKVIDKCAELATAQDIMCIRPVLSAMARDILTGIHISILINSGKLQGGCAMALAIVILILIISFSIEQIRASQWKKDRLKEEPNYTNTYTDFFGMDRDRKTNEPRFFGTDMSGDRIVYDKNHKVISNLSQRNEDEKFIAQSLEAKETGQRAVELDFLPSELKQYPDLLWAQHKYKDIKTGANYIIISGSSERGMDLAHYYYDYKRQRVVCPSDGFTKRFEDPKLCRVYNTRSLAQRDELSWEDVLNEIPLLQDDIKNNGFDKWSICDRDDLFGLYFKNRRS